MINNEDPEFFHLDENVVINLLWAKSKDFYWLTVDKKYKEKQTAGPKRWNQSVPMDKTNWTNIFKSVQKTCRENKVREFHFKFIHRIVVTKKELLRFNIKPDSNCIYCGDLDSIDHTFSECQFTKSFTKEVLQWFNTENDSEFNLNTEDLLFGIYLDKKIELGTLSSFYGIIFIRKNSRMTHHFYYFPTSSTKLNISISLKKLSNIHKSLSICYSIHLR